MKDGGGNQTHVSLDSDPEALSLSYIHPVGTAGFEPANFLYPKQVGCLASLRPERPRRMPEAEAILGRASFRHELNVDYRSRDRRAIPTPRNVIKSLLSCQTGGGRCKLMHCRLSLSPVQDSTTHRNPTRFAFV
jgi:hypothetical protein